ncbi:glycosyltransferase family 4 protein [Sphingobium sp. CR28]|uniref:glycosyltransferase family 4 protein n=1 Tax=Sphingobium sp. CR28 TaxID=3400272 RepID=UPI003FEEDC4E
MAGPPYSILQMHGSFDRGSKEDRVVRLMNEWAGKVRHTLLVASPGHDAARADLHPHLNVSFITAPRLSGPAGLGKFRALARLMRDFDLVLTYGWGAMDGVMAHRLFHRVMRLPHLIHHEDGLEADEKDRRKAGRSLYRRIALASADALVVPSTALGRVAQAEWGQPADKVKHIPNGIDISGFDGTARRPAILGLSENRKLVVGTTAEAGQGEALRRLVRAVAPLTDAVKLAIAGEASEAIVADAKRLGLTDIVVLGPQERTQDYIRAFDIFVPLPGSDAFPVALVQAMAARLPVVATDIGDISAMVGSANRSFIVPGNDDAAVTTALRALVVDKAKREALGEANRRRAEECFAESAMIERYGRLYREAIEAYRGPLAAG